MRNWYLSILFVVSILIASGPVPSEGNDFSEACSSAGPNVSGRTATRSLDEPGSMTIFNDRGDFDQGTLSELRYDDEDLPELDQVSKFVLDEYMDDVLVEEINGAYIDKDLGMVKQRLMDTYGGNWDEMGRDALTASDGGTIFLSGMSWMNQTIGMDLDLHIVRLDAGEDLLWNRSVFITGEVEPYSITETLDGGFTIAGSYRQYSYSVSDTILIHVNSTGHYQWDSIIDIEGGDAARWVIEKNDGSYLIVGDWINITDSGYYVLGTDMSGDHVYNVTISMGTETSVEDVISTAAGDIVIVGNTYPDMSSSDAFIARVSYDGIEFWNVTYRSPMHNEEARGVVEKDDGSFFVCGMNEEYSTYYEDAWLIKIDPSGNEEMNRTYDLQAFEFANDIIITDNGLVLAGGQTFYGGTYLSMIMKTDMNGNLLWSRLFGGAAWDEAVNVRSGKEGFLVSGFTSSYGNGGLDLYIYRTNSTGYIRPARVVSKNLLEGLAASSMYQFEVISDASIDRKVMVSFSRDGDTWVDSNGVEGGSDEVLTSPGRIDLNPLGWTGYSFYYMIRLGSSGSNSASVGSIRLKYRSYAPVGVYYSPVLDLGSLNNFTEIGWTSDVPEGTTVDLQVRSSAIEGDIVVGPYTGPDGTESTRYHEPSSLFPLHFKKRFFQFRCFLETTDQSRTPVLREVRINHNSIPGIISMGVTPVVGDVTRNFTFHVVYQDLDGDPPESVAMTIDGSDVELTGDPGDANHTHGRNFTVELDLLYGEHNFSFTASDGLDVCFTGNSTVNVTKGPLHSVEVASESYEMTTDDTMQFSAKGFDIDGNELEVMPIWTVSGGGTMDINGLFEPILPGNFTVYANVSGIVGKADITISVGALHSLSIEPREVKLTTDEYVQFIAYGEDSRGNLIDLEFLWEVTGGGIMDETGNFTASRPGTYIVYANSSGMSVQTGITIDQGRVFRLELSANRTMTHTGETIALTASAFDEDGNELDVDIYFASEGGTISQEGYFASMSAGTFTITAESQGVSDTITVTVEDEPTPPDDDDTDDDDDDEKEVNMLLILVPAGGILLVAIIIALLLFLRSRKGGEEEPEKEEEKDLYADTPTLKDIYSNEERSGAASIESSEDWFKGYQDPVEEEDSLDWDEDLED